ncbi:hypothetical protein GQ53DRAFT_835565 [Thozetella sp. PMI_491]|nr:hypothetical protein GQ53DRAFT_835565 [Thozetella sp. PMI_491]
MSGLLRSKRGCWTCRLRKKKCDEGQPFCSTCTSLAITCYGYGPKPDWMDNSQKRRTILIGLAGAVRSTSKRMHRSGTATKLGQPPMLAPKPLNKSVSSRPILRLEPTSQSKVKSRIPEDAEPRLVPDVFPNTLSPAREAQPRTALLEEASVDDYILLMHFLDSVFPLQYPFYRPDIAQGGRGWLLSMLLNNKPLYHAALATSAYHRRICMRPKESKAWHMTELGRQESHLAASLELVHRSAGSSCPNNGIGIAASILQLLFLELFTGQSNGWQAHLRVLSSMLLSVHERGFSGVGLSDETTAVLGGKDDITGQNGGGRADLTSFRVLGATMIWLDIMFSVTAGTASSSWPKTLFSGDVACQIQLQDVMGCKNWVMIQIGRIAQLHQYKTQALKEKVFDHEKMKRTADMISKDIHLGLIEHGLQAFEFIEGTASRPCGVESGPVEYISYVYAHTALIYLHLVFRDFQELQGIGSSKRAILDAIRTSSARQHLSTLVYPLYICGCVAEPQDEQFFRDVFSSSPLMHASLQHRARILPLLENIWHFRQTAQDFTWQDSVALSFDILLY